MPETKHYTARRVFTGDKWLQNQAIVTTAGTITAIEPANSGIEYDSIIPAFIDLQIYGAADRLFSVYPDATTLTAIHQYCCEGGAYWFQPTVATNTPGVFRKAIDGVRAYRSAGGEGCIGLHLEGPWINADKRGAHIAGLVHAPGIEEVRSILDYGRGVISMITLAPEVCSDEVIRLILDEGIIISAGHSNASFGQAMAAFDKGISTVTHLYNAMSPLMHRQPGLVGASMLHEAVMASIIADGHHVDFPAIKIAKSVMKERLFLITDAVTTTGQGAYQHELQGDKYVAAGILSGSAINMFQSVKNLVTHCGIDETEAIRMACLYPARAVKRTKMMGGIQPGMPAKFLATNESLSEVRLLS